jgi:hypothetical protein
VIEGELEGTAPGREGAQILDVALGQLVGRDPRVEQRDRERDPLADALR